MFMMVKRMYGMRYAFITFDVVMTFLTAMMGMKIHGDALWAILNGIFWPFVWIKWLFCHMV